jgi:crotonobetainyl-CoA:carnitine CoA-transferase CaiB-like acyl-CoA transferase
VRFATRAGRIEHQEELIRILSGLFALRSRADWAQRLEQQDVPHAPIYDSSEALEDPQARHLQLLVAGEHPTMGAFRTVRCPVSFDGQRALEVSAPPVLGEHDAQVRAELAEQAEAAQPLSKMAAL